MMNVNASTAQMFLMAILQETHTVVRQGVHTFDEVLVHLEDSADPDPNPLQAFFLQGHSAALWLGHREVRNHDGHLTLEATEHLLPSIRWNP
jgi:hypothetical protein